MDVEDTDDKVRRNLVAVSTVVLLSAWLQVKIGELLERLLGTKASDPIDSQKAWAAVVALMVYTMLRFRAADSTQTQQQDLMRRIRETRGRKVADFFYRDLARFEVSGEARFLETTALRGVPLDALPDLPGHRRRYSTAGGMAGGHERVQDVEIHVADHPHHSTSVTARFEVPRARWAIYTALSTLEAVLLSRPGLEVAYPCALGALALLYAIKSLLGL